MRRAKIVCTLGPGNRDARSRSRELVDAGMDVARLNLSHGDYADHEQHLPERPQGREDSSARPSASSPTCRARRSASAGSPTGRRPRWTSATRSRSPPRTSRAPRTSCSTTYKGLPGDVSPGDALLIDDGKVALRSIEVDGADVVTQVDRRRARSRTTRASTCPASRSASRRCPRRTRTTCAGPCACGVDIIALSFVRSAADIERRARDHGRGGPSRCPSSPRSRSRRRSRTSTRSSTPSTASWSPAATSASSCRSRRCRSCRSGPSSWPAAAPSRSSSPPRCSSR